MDSHCHYRIINNTTQLIAIADTLSHIMESCGSPATDMEDIETVRNAAIRVRAPHLAAVDN